VSGAWAQVAMEIPAGLGAIGGAAGKPGYLFPVGGLGFNLTHEVNFVGLKKSAPLPQEMNGYHKC
jgi:hypothetical protein